MSRVLRNTSATLAVTFEADGTPVAADGAVTVTATRADGTVVATAAPTTHTGDAYTYVLAPQAALTVITATWSGSFSGAAQTITTTVEIVGGFFFTLAALRATAGIADSSTFSTADLAAARARAEDYIEHRVGAALVRRYGTETIGRGSLYAGGALPVRSFVRRVLSLAVDGTALSAGDLAALEVEDWGKVARPGSGSFSSGRVVIAYEHGYSDEPPAELAAAALTRARHDLLGWTADAPSHSVEVAELGTTDPAAANADMMAGRTQMAEAIKTWRASIIGMVVA